MALSPKSHPEALKYRKIIAGSFFGTLVPMIYFFIQHKVHKVAGGEFVNTIRAKYIADEWKHTLRIPSLNGVLYFWTSDSTRSLP